MPALQIRNLPDDLYQLLRLRAERAHRSLAQQTVAELRAALGVSGATRRRQVLDRLAAETAASGKRRFRLRPEALVREDRDR